MQYMEKPVTTAENILLIDTEYLNFLTHDIKSHFEPRIGRTLKDIDIVDLICYLSLDAELPRDASEKSVFFIYNKNSEKFLHCTPASLAAIDGMHFGNPVGSFHINAFSNEGLVSIEDMFLDSLQTLCEAGHVRRIAVMGNNEAYGTQIEEILSKTKGKLRLIQFRMDEPKGKTGFDYTFPAYAIMHAFGITENDL